jgi:hypothetical protein
MRTHLLLPFAFLALAACSSQPPEPWEKPDHTPPTVTETSYCHQDARRQAETLYPDRAPNDAVGQPRTSDERRFPTEIRLYEQCMTRSGFVRAAVAPAR